MKTLLSIGQAAERLGLSVDTLREMERSGVLKAERTPGGHRRFSPATLDAYLGRLPARPRPNHPARASASMRRKQPIHAHEEPLDWLPADEEQDELQPVTPRTPPAAPAAPSAHDTWMTEFRQTTRDNAERNRLDSLRSYAHALIPWNASPSARSAVLETVASYVTASRFPASAPSWEANQAIKAKVEAVLEPFAQAAAREATKKAEVERRAQRVRSLIEHGKSRARLKTIGWGYDDSREALADVQEELDSDVETNWSEREVDDLVDEVLEEWDEESED
jgi:excisionase family DNA binding protein